MTRRQFAVTVTDEDSERLQAKLAAAERDLRTLGHNTDEAAATALDAGTRIKELERDLAAATARAAKLESACNAVMDWYTHEIYDSVARDFAMCQVRNALDGQETERGK